MLDLLGSQNRSGALNSIVRTTGAVQERPGERLGRPKSGPRAAKRALRVAKSAPRAAQEQLRGAKFVDFSLGLGGFQNRDVSEQMKRKKYRKYIPNVSDNEKRLQTPLSVHSWVRLFFDRFGAVLGCQHGAFLEPQIDPRWAKLGSRWRLKASWIVLSRRC